MDGWIGGWVDGWTDGCTGGWTRGWTRGWVDESMCGWVEGWRGDFSMMEKIPSQDTHRQWDSHTQIYAAVGRAQL